MKAQQVFPWSDQEGNLLGYIVRLNKNIKSLTIFYCKLGDAFKFCQCGWSQFQTERPKPLYNLPSMLGKETHLVLQGERKTKLVFEMFPDYGVVTNQGGDQHVRISDWSVLQGEKVILCPDNDSSGFKAAKETASLLSELSCEIQILVPDSSKPEHYDLADSIDEGHTRESIEKYIYTNTKDYSNQLIDDLITKANSKHITSVIQPLGYNGSDFYYQSRAHGQVVKLTPAQHNANYFLSLVDLDFWAKHFPLEEA